MGLLIFFLLIAWFLSCPGDLLFLLQATPLVVVFVFFPLVLLLGCYCWCYEEVNKRYVSFVKYNRDRMEKEKLNEGLR